MNDIRLALLYQKIDNNSILNDPADTIYYGARIKDPDFGIHYTFLKSPNGDIGLLRTENTDKVLEDISNLIEVCVDEVKESPVKLTFLLKWNSTDNITTWGDTITNEFLLEFSKSFEKLKVTIPSYLINNKKYQLTPFLSDENVAISFKLTDGRDILYLKEAIPELFRRIYNEELISIDNIDKLFKDSFLEMDLLKANDSRQDNDVIKASIVTLRSQAIRKNIEDWLNANINLFQSTYYKYDIDTRVYSNNMRCYILLESKNILDDPVIISEISTNDSLMFVKHTTSGYPLNTEIRYAAKNKLEVAEQIRDHTFVMYGNQQGVIYSSTPNLLVKVIRTTEVAPLEYMEKHDTLISEYLENNGLIFKQGGRYYTFNITGSPSKNSEVGKVRDFIWRMATKTGWGAGWGISNTDALKQDRDIGDACNTRTIIPLSITLEDLKAFDTLKIYIDDWYAVASGGGNGGIHYYNDYTGRMCYQGYAVYANNEASIPTSKLNIPLIMDNEIDAQNAHLKLDLDMKTFKWDGSWNRIYNAPTGNHGLSVSQTRRKNRLLGGYNFRYYLRIRDNKYLELLCEYQQNADGDDGDNCYTQGAARMGIYIHGNKLNTMRINIIDYFTKEIVYSYPATDVKMTTPALQIIDVENNYLAYLGLSDVKQNGFNILDTNTNKIYYAKEIIMNKQRLKSERILVEEYENPLDTLKVSSENILVDATLNISYAQIYEAVKTSDIYVDKVYYSPSDGRYYMYNEDTQNYKEIDYDSYLEENNLNMNIVPKLTDLGVTPYQHSILPLNSLILEKPTTYKIEGDIAQTIDNLLKNEIKFQIPLKNNSYSSIIINDSLKIEVLFLDGEIQTYYASLDGLKYLVNANYIINEVNK